MLAKSLADERDSGSDSAIGEGADEDAEYAFDGFRIMFSEKIMLTPAALLPMLELARTVH